MTERKSINAIANILDDEKDLDVKKEEEDVDKIIKELDIDIEKKLGANKTLYLENEIIEKIKNVSKKMRTSQSKLVNEILKKVL